MTSLSCCRSSQLELRPVSSAHRAWSGSDEGSMLATELATGSSWNGGRCRSSETKRCAKQHIMELSLTPVSPLLDSQNAFCHSIDCQPCRWVEAEEQAETWFSLTTQRVTIVWGVSPGADGSIELASSVEPFCDDPPVFRRTR